MNCNYESIDFANGITVKKLSISIGSSLLLDNTDLTISEGVNYGLIAPNGHGKTTLMRFINEHIQLDGGRKVHMVKQEEVTNDNTVLEEVLSSHAEYTKYMEEEKILTAEDNEDPDLDEKLEQLYEDYTSNCLDRVESEAKKILYGLGFQTNTSYDKKVKDYSGGWRMRVSLAKALLTKPHILLLDEPTNHLDLDAVIWLGDYLQRWNKTKSTKRNTLILISHDYNFMDEITNTTLRINEKKVLKYDGNQSRMFRMIEQERKKELKKWEKDKKQFKSKKARRNNRPKKEYKVDFEFKEDVKDCYITLSDVTFGYNKDKILLENVDFHIESGDRIALVGKNGIGKSTFLKILCERFTSEVKDMEHNNIQRQGTVKHIGFYTQHSTDVLEYGLTPVQFMQKIYKDWNMTDIRKHLSKYNLDKSVHKVRINECSGGQKARIMMATLSDSDLLVLDEPTNHLDTETIDGLIEALEKFKGGLIVVSHDTRFIDALECKLYVCKDQNILPFGGDIFDYQSKVIDEYNKMSF